MKLLIYLFMFLLFPASAFAQEESALLRDLDQKLTRLEAKVNRLDAIGEQMIQKQSEIAKELDSLKIWIRRNRG